MRYSRIKEHEYQGRSGGKGAIVIVILVLAAAFYLIGASKVGEFLSDNVVTPVVAWVTGETPKPKESDGKHSAVSAAPEPSGSQASPSASATADAPVSKTISIDANTVYALQVGVFDQEQNAEDMAQSLRSKGGAGYIVKEGESYRVLISAYKTEAEAQNVKTRLVDEQKLDSKLYNIATEKVNIELSAPEEFLSQLEEAIQKSSETHDALLDLSLAYDKGEKTIDQVKDELKSLQENGKKIADAMGQIDQTGTVAAVSSIKTFYSRAESALGKLLDAETQVTMSSGIKSAYLDVAMARKALISSFS